MNDSGIYKKKQNFNVVTLENMNITIICRHV